MNMFDKPSGGTELMHQELTKRLPPEYLEKFSIFNYPVHADTSKKLIYWNQLSYDQPAVQFLQDQESVNQIDHFVFVSNWQAERFRQTFNIPGFKTQVIQNACIGIPERKVRKPKGKIKVCYTSTPWRGLDVLLDAWEILKPDNAELHIFSGTQIYGPDFAESEESKYTQLYQKAQSLPNVTYHGNIANDVLRSKLVEFDILAYPNTFEETSCISVIEALSAGLRVITSNLGALPETTEGWARMYPFFMDKTLHAQKFASILAEELQSFSSGKLESHLQKQVQIYRPKWSWDTRIEQWKTYLNQISEL
jgi:glycosyltransferase involved in cell wall biosynthesis